MKNLILILCLLSAQLTIQAQGNRDGIRDRIKSERIAFLTKEMNLSPEDAQRFWPVVNKYSSELEEAKKNQRRLRIQTYPNVNKLSNQELEKYLKDELELNQKIHSLEQAMHKELTTVISPLLHVKYYQAERKFRMELLKRIKESSGRFKGEDLD